MSLRAEYSHASVRNDAARKWEVTVFHHQIGSASAVGRESVDFEFQIEACANRLIRAHMEKVTQELENGAPRNYEQEEENDRLAHRGDQQQQEEKDHE